MAKKEASNMLNIANSEIAFQNSEKEKRAAELEIANKELAFQNAEKEKRANELLVANKKLVFENEEKEKRASELLIANKKLVFENEETEKRAAELEIANKELAYQNAEKVKRAEELLLANKELTFLHQEFASVVNYSDDAIVSLTLEGRVTSWNYGAEKIFGYKASEITGKSILTFIPPSFHDEEREILKNIREGKTIDHFSTERLRKDGTVFYASVAISSIRNSKGEIVGASKILRDISDIKRIEEDKIRQANRFLLATQSANIAIWDWNLENNIVVGDDAMYKLYGIDLNDFDPLYNGWISRIHPEDRQKVESDLQLAIENKKDYDCEFRVVWDDLSIHYVKATGIVERDSNGIAKHMIGANLDITLQKQKEHQKNSLLTTLEKSLNEIYVFDAETFKFSYVNKGALLNNGYSEQEIKELTPLDINPEFTATTFNELVNPLVTNEKEKIIFFTNHKRKNGSLYPVEIHLQFVVEGNNKRFLAVILDITERKKAEEELRSAIEKAQESDARFKAYAQQSPIAIYTTDMNGDCLYANETWLKMAAMQLEDALGKGWINALHPEDLEYVSDNWYKSIESNGEWDYEYRFLNSNKNIIWVNGSAKKLFNDKNEQIGYLGSNINITERKKAEEELRNTEERRKLIMNAALDAIICIDKDGMITFWNPQAEQIFGWSENEVMGKILSSIIIPENFRSMHDNGMKNYLKTGKGPALNILLQLSAIRRDGTEFPIELTVLPIRQDGEEFFCAFIRDITERKKAEEQLKLFASVVTNTTDSVLITDAEPFEESRNRILYVNDAFTKMTGYTAKDVIGKTPSILQGPRSDKNELKRVGEAMRKWQSFETTLINYKKNGEEFWVNFKVTPVANEKGWYTHWIAIERDVTEQKLTELKLTTLVKELADYKFALDQSSIVDIADENGMIKYVNDNFIAISKFSREELIGQDHTITNFGYDDGKFIQNLWATIANGKIWKGELKNKAKGGSIYWVDTTIVPFLNNEGKPYQYIAIRNDITERHKHQITIEAQNEKLRDIAWTQSHIIRAPLARMLGLLNIMEMEDFKLDDIPQLMTYFKNSLHELDDVIMEIVQKTESLDL